MLYYFNITTILFADNYYPSKYVQSVNTFTTKGMYGDNCMLDSQCDQPMKCNNNTCVCQSDRYYDDTTVSCLLLNVRKDVSSSDSPAIWLIAVAAVGWTAALATVAAIIFLCMRNERNRNHLTMREESSPSKIQDDPITDSSPGVDQTNQGSHSENRPKNEYRKLPSSNVHNDEQTNEYVNQQDIIRQSDLLYANCNESGIAPENEEYETIEINTTSQF